MTGPPPPPPPGPPPPPPPAAAGGASSEDAAGALFASINALGEDGVRAGLKKATRGPVNTETPAVAPKPAAPKPAAAPAAAKPKQPAVCALQGKKWAVEFQEGNDSLEITVADPKHTVYIYKCNKGLLQVKGKCNSISIDSCSKFNVVFENAVSQCEIVNSKDIQVQCTGVAPSINIDNCTAVTYYLSKEAVETAHVITSKVAAINLIRPKPDDPDDILEQPIPEQFLTVFKDGNWVTEAVSHDD
eukprot:CAMPEP_0198328964 /NCGR_PEP_ID=MMETSP1450-20131203/15835_1 /TAXON_ID=753684 ORGANISM="Madagascaria erythrocladiodes, Strain CCMP3234" /NCGR_SAMPLE_ID=MMETSP1450 /ASSEMBLY_ACC=CAM_ASM_001115 /LENGTH=244 /DNA_ID=CAMNT_0044033131 /DNA_START=190 /DNA_END=924 /DNA_ORIENTATION=+